MLYPIKVPIFSSSTQQKKKVHYQLLSSTLHGTLYQWFGPKLYSILLSELSLVEVELQEIQSKISHGSMHDWQKVQIVYIFHVNRKGLIHFHEA